MAYEPIVEDSRVYKTSFAPTELTHRCCSCFHVGLTLSLTTGLWHLVRQI